jgi:hypothetical protein
MRHFLIALALCSFWHSSVGIAATKGPPPPSKQQLTGLSLDEAASLIETLEDAQRDMRQGKSRNFELLSGSSASNKQTKVSPQKVFLQIPFAKVWNIERLKTENSFRQSYRLDYSPDGLGQRYWEVEVAMGPNQNIQGVVMIYKLPAPF